MDPKDRDKIRDNLEELVKVTKWNATLEKSVDGNTILRKVLEKIRPGSTETEIKKVFYEQVQRRGPSAFQYLMDSLFLSGNEEAASILNPDFVQSKMAQSSKSNDFNSKVWNPPSYDIYLPDQNVSVNDDQTPLIVRVKRATQFNAGSKLSCYKMSSNPRGHVYIIDNEDFVNDVFKKREGSHVDSRNLDCLFTELGFKVTIKRNQSFQEMRTGIQKFSQLMDHGDMSVLVILSHGHKDVIFSCDGRSVSTDWILRQFNNASCPGLRGKPKFFIFQACRGDEPDYGCVKSGGTTSTDAVGYRPIPKEKDPTWEDILIANATVSGYVAIRDHYRGTWFIESICQVFMEYACEYDIRDMLDLVGQKMGAMETEYEEKQSCSYEVIHFFKKLFFNPGLYLESTSSTDPDLLQNTENLELAESVPTLNNLPINQN